jgi:two-component system cell cycle sensor histidine kinase/response regulator CckA
MSSPSSANRDPGPDTPKASAVSGSAGPSAYVDAPMLEHMGRLFDVTHELLAVIGMEDRRVRFLNASWEAVLGYSREELMATPLRSLIHADDLAASMRDIEKVGQGEPSTNFVNRLRCKDGTYRWLSWSSIADVSQGCFYVAARDITEQKRAEERAARLAHAFEDNSEMIAMGGADGRAVFVNRALLQATGYTEDELLGKMFSETVVSPNNPPGREETYRSALAKDGKWSGECYLRRKDGSDFPVSLSSSVLRDSDGRFTGTFAICQDLSEKRRVEQRSTLLAQALEHNTEMICLGDDRGRAIFVNQALLKMSGYEESEMIGKPFDETLLSSKNPPGLAAEIRDSLTREGRWTGEALQRRKNGPDMPVSLTLGVVRDKDGRVISGFGISQDITEKKNLEEQLRRAQKMEAVGQLAGGVAHDFNNLLMVIIGYASDLADRLEAGSALRREASEIAKAGHRAASLTRQLLAFSRQQVLEPTVLNLNSLVEDMRKMLRRVINEDIELVTSLDPALSEVKADQGQLEQVVINLVVNARDAMTDGGKLTIETSNVMVDEAFARQHPPMKAGEYVRLSVSDTGTGMDEATLSRVFEPFFTTKEPGKGTGLGLSTVYGVVKQSGGFVWASSEPGQGARFDVYLPPVRAKAAEIPSATNSPGVQEGSEKILLVEDDEALRSLIVDSLRGWGYDVLEAANGTDAISIAQSRCDEIDLLLSDVVMPGMNGPQVAEKVVSLNPEIKVLFMSGYADIGPEQGEYFGKDRRLLQKPYRLPELARTIREVLGSSREMELASL